MKLKVISDGTIRGTKIMNPETGEPLGGVQRVLIDLNAGAVFASGTIVTAKQEFVCEGDFATARDVVDRFLLWASAKLEPEQLTVLRGLAAEYEATRGGNGEENPHATG